MECVVSSTAEGVEVAGWALIQGMGTRLRPLVGCRGRRLGFKIGRRRDGEQGQLHMGHNSRSQTDLRIAAAVF